MYILNFASSYLNNRSPHTCQPAGCETAKKYENLCDILRVLCENNILAT
jgi:hypothetical protein